MSSIEPESVVTPGTGETPATPDSSSAGTSNTDSGSGGPPETVPYSRFKEVNEAHRPYRELEDMGYDADSLRRLTEWEAQFAADPVGQWLDLAGRLDGMPEAVVQAIRQASAIPHQGTESKPDSGDTNTTQEPTNDPPEWAAPLIADYSERQTAAEHAARQQTLQTIVDKWDALDKAEGIEVPEKLKLSFIAGAAGSATSVDQIIEIARGEAKEMLELGAKSVIVPTGSPRSVPGDATAPGSEPIAPRTLAEATRMAKADLAEGRLKI